MVVVISVSSVAAEQRFSLKNLVKSGSNSYLTEGKTLNEAKGGKNKTKNLQQHQELHLALDAENETEHDGHCKLTREPRRVALTSTERDSNQAHTQTHWDGYFQVVPLSSIISCPHST